MAEVHFDEYPFLAELGLQKQNFGCYNGQWLGNGTDLNCINPHNGHTVAIVKQATVQDLNSAISSSKQAWIHWRNTPAPIRGQIVRQIGDAVRQKKEALGKLVSLAMGKVLSEGLGQIQQFIDICDYAVGLSRMISGKVLPSERAEHLLLQTWNPLGVIGVITAFNFPAAPFGWNFAIAAVCGDCTVWKGASTTALVTIAMTKVVTQVFQKNGLPAGILSMVVGPGSSVGEAMLSDPALKLVSFTGSTSIGRHVSEVVHNRFGRTILELGGNNCAVIMEDADLEIALLASAFSAVGTSGQRCTTLRRIAIQEQIYQEFKNRIVAAYAKIRIGDPLDPDTLMGPLHTQTAVREFTEGLETIKAQGGTVLYGGNVLEREGFYVEPTIVEIAHDAPIVKEELFVPILYLFKFGSIEEGIAINNEVPQGLSSCMFTKNMQYMWTWLGPNGSDCGLVNVNMGPSGAEIGVAFGGEKETGEGRESGSDAWKQYMKRGSCAINYGSTLPLAQGVKFDI